MVLDDVPGRPGLLVEAAPLLDPDRLGHRDLHVVDVAAVPEGLEDPVPEAEDHQVPDGLLAQVMVDPVDLRLPEDLADLAIEALGRVEVAPEGLLDDDPPPAPAVDLVVEAAASQLADDEREGRRLGRQVEEAVAPRAELLVHVVEADGERVEGAVVGEVALVVDDPAEELLGHLGVQLDPAELGEGLGDLGPEGLVVVGPAADRDEHPVLGQEVRPPQLGERREDLAVAEVAGRPEEDHDVGIGDALEAQALAEGVGVVLGRVTALAAPLQAELRIV